MKAQAAALLTIFLSVLTQAHAQTTNVYNAQLVFTQAAELFSRNDTLKPLAMALYDLSVPTTYSTPDLLLTLNSTNGGTGLGLYCGRRGSQPGPGYSLWSSDLSTTENQLYISKNNIYYSQILQRVSNVPALTCGIFNGDTNQTNEFSFSLKVISSNQTLVASEQVLLANLYSRCCAQTGTCSAWKALSNSQGSNANGGMVMTDFCSFPGQVCTPSANLYQLDLSGFNMSCPFPSDILGQFSQLTTLFVRGNNLQGNSTAVGQTFDALKNLQFFDGTGNSGLSGTYDSGAARTGLCNSAKRSLISLTMTQMNASGSIPDCLYGPGSQMFLLQLDQNSFSGTLNDTIPVNSNLQSFILASNQLQGNIPASLGNAAIMINIDLSTNQFSGSIPSGIGAIWPLVSFTVYSNNLSGPIPDSFGTAQNLQVFDAKQNRLTALPAAWTNASYDASSTSFIRIRASMNTISGPFPSGLVTAPQLQYVVLNENNLTGPLPAKDNMFPGLRALNVSSNQLNGTIPVQFNSSSLFGQTALLQLSGQPLQQVFDVSYNRLTGSLPSFMARGNLPTWVSSGINLQGNSLNVSCQDNSFNYISSICPQGAQSASNQQVALRPPPAAVQRTSTTPADSATSITTSSGAAPQPKHHHGGLSGGAIAGIVVGAIAGAAILAAIVGLVVYKMRSSSGVGMGELGRSISLSKGLTSQSSGNGGNPGIGKFQQFVDEEGQKTIELSPSRDLSKV